MGKKFWFGYIAFFVFVFPLFFSFAGSYIWSPLMSTIALAIGVVAWLIFIVWTYVQTIAQPKKMQKSIHSLIQRGRLEQGKVVEKTLLKKRKDKTEAIELVVEFKNLSNTLVRQTFQLTDSRPNERRYEKGNSVNLRITTENQYPAIILADAKAITSLTFGIIALAFIVIYMIGTFMAHYYYFSNGTGWRFITLWHPWVFTPFFGLLFFGGIGRLMNFFGRSPKSEEQLILYGRKATATIQRADQTGTYINEQPQIKFVLRFTDYAGQPRTVTLKKIVPLTQLHFLNVGGTQNVLYLPDNPEELMFV